MIGGNVWQTNTRDAQGSVEDQDVQDASPRVIEQPGREKLQQNRSCDEQRVGTRRRIHPPQRQMPSRAEHSEAKAGPQRTISPLQTRQGKSAPAGFFSERSAQQQQQHKVGGKRRPMVTKSQRRE